MMYLPVKNLTEFKLIVKSLEQCLEKRALAIHALLIDSAATVVSWTFVENVDKGYTMAYNTVVKKMEALCKTHSVFLVYTKKPTSNLKLTGFCVQLRQSENGPEDQEKPTNDSNNSMVKEEGEAVMASLALVPFTTQTQDDDSSFEKDFYPTSLETMLVDPDNASNDEKSDEDPAPTARDQNQPDAVDCDRIMIRSCIPDSWINPDQKVSRRDRMTLFLSFSRSEDKTYITFMSRDYRTRAEDPKVISVCSVSGPINVQTAESQRTIRGRMGYHNGPDWAVSGFSEDESQASMRGWVDLGTGSVRATEELKVFDSDDLSKHDFRVYRIDSTTTFTLCEHDPLDFNG